MLFVSQFSETGLKYEKVYNNSLYISAIRRIYLTIIVAIILFLKLWPMLR